MSLKCLPPYEPRRIAPGGMIELEGWRVKVYLITLTDGRPEEALYDAAIQRASESLRERSRMESYGVAFLGIHEGRNENQVFLDRWINQNELMHQFWVSPKDDPGGLTTSGPDHNSVCVWDLFVQSFERESWLRHVLAARVPDLNAYLADFFDGWQ